MTILVVTVRIFFKNEVQNTFYPVPKSVTPESQALSKIVDYTNRLKYVKSQYQQVFKNFDNSSDVHLKNQTKISASLVIMVISARQNVIRRKTIRETWAKDHKNVIFIVGKEHCEVPPQFRKYSFECNLKNATIINKRIEKLKSLQDKYRQSPSKKTYQEIKRLFQKKPSKTDALVDQFIKNLEKYNSAERYRTEQLKKEPGVILVDGFIDSYRNLTAKIFNGYKYISQNFDMNELKWVMKCDDDVYVRVDKLEEYLEFSQKRRPKTTFWREVSKSVTYSAGKVFDYQKPTVIGNLNPSATVLRGKMKWKKWHDPYFNAKELTRRVGDYNITKYPLYPDGGASYIFSKYIFDYIVENINNQEIRYVEKFKDRPDFVFPNSTYTPIQVYSNKFRVFNWPVEDAGFGVMMYRAPFRKEIGWFPRCNSTGLEETYRQKCKNDEFLEKIGGIFVDNDWKCYGSFRGIIFSHKLGVKAIKDCHKKLTRDYLRDFKSQAEIAKRKKIRKIFRQIKG